VTRADQAVETPYIYKVLTIVGLGKGLEQKDIALHALDSTFIHCSKKEQLGHVTQKFFSNEPYVVLRVETDRLVGDLVFETKARRYGKVLPSFRWYDTC